MLSWRARRQLIVLAILTIPIALIFVFFAFKILPESSCFDNRKNQRELGVDCGGPCAPCELKNPKPISLFWARLVSVRENQSTQRPECSAEHSNLFECSGSYDLVALIQNPNEVLFSQKVDYTFTFFDKFAPFAEKSGSTFILPQERVHIVEPNIHATREPSHVELKITGVDWKYSKVERPNFAVESRKYLVEEENGVKRSVV